MATPLNTSMDLVGSSQSMVSNACRQRSLAKTPGILNLDDLEAGHVAFGLKSLCVVVSINAWRAKVREGSAQG